MMVFETHKEGPSVNIVTRSGIATEKDEGKKLEENVWVCKAANKEARFDVNKVKEMFMETKMELYR